MGPIALYKGVLQNSDGKKSLFFGLKRPFIAVAPVLAVFCPEMPRKRSNQIQSDPIQRSALTALYRIGSDRLDNYNALDRIGVSDPHPWGLPGSSSLKFISRVSCRGTLWPAFFNLLAVRIDGDGT